MVKMAKSKARKIKPEAGRGAQTRQKVLNTTRELLATEGIHNLRFAHIAKKAKVPQALMGYHFPTYEALLIEVVIIELEKLKVFTVDRVEQNSTHPKKALAAYIRAPFEMAVIDKTARAVWTAFYHLATISPEFAELNLAIRKTGLERILNLVTMTIATEKVATNSQQLFNHAQLLGLARAVHGLITGLLVIATTEANQNIDELREVAVQSCFQLLNIK